MPGGTTYPGRDAPRPLRGPGRTRTADPSPRKTLLYPLSYGALRALREIRTPDTLFRRQVLCPLSYEGNEPKTGIEPALPVWKTGTLPLSYLGVGGVCRCTPGHGPAAHCAWTGTGSDRRPSVLQADALPTELPVHSVRGESGVRTHARDCPPTSLANWPLYRLGTSPVLLLYRVSGRTATWQTGKVLRTGRRF